MDNTLHLLIMYTMLVLMLILLHKGRNNRRSRYLATYAFIEVATNSIDSLSVWFGSSIYEKFPAIPFLAKPISLLWVPFFYFYVQACFSKEFKIKKLHFLHLLPFAVVQLFFLILRIEKNGHEIAMNIYDIKAIEGLSLYVTDICIRLQYIIYNTFLITQLIKTEKDLQLPQNNNLIVDIRWMRFIIYGYALACSGAIVTFIIFHFNWKLASVINRFSILYFFLFFFLIFYNTLVSIPTKKLRTKNDPTDTVELTPIIDQIKNLFKDSPLHLDANLTLEQLASALNQKERTISQAINTIENRTFKDFINELRIEHAIHLLSSDENKPVFEVMYESGFNSKGSFNSAFKKFTGKTPSEFRSKNNLS